MSESSSVDYGEIAKRAKAALEGKGLTDPYLSIAYEKTFERMLAEAERLARSPTPPKPRGTVTAASATSPLELFMSRAVESSSYSRLFAAKGRLLEKSLAILKLARDEFGIDAMTPADIARVLIQKYHVAKVDPSHVSRDLAKAREYASPVKGENKYPRYLLTTRGESYLSEIVAKAET